MADDQQSTQAPQGAGATPATPAPQSATPESVPTDPQALTDQFKKDELQTAAAVQGVDVPASATKVDIATAIVEQTPKAQPVLVNNYTQRDENDAILGSWVDVVSGPHQGLYGSYVDDVSHDPASGYPSSILIRTRDAQNELVEVAYSDVRPSKRTGGR